MAKFPFLYPEPFEAIEPRWANAEHTKIDCKIIFPHLGEEPVPFTAAQSDPGWEHGEIIFATLSDPETRAEMGIEIAPYVPPSEPVPAAISDRQFADELKARGIISHAERMAFIRIGELPAPLASLLAALPTEAEREDAESLISGATTFERAHPLTSAIAAGFGWDSEDTDNFFRAASAR